MVIINGQQFTDDEFAKLQEEQLRRKEEEFERFRNSVKCGYAIIPDMNVTICGLDLARVEPSITCKICASYNEKVFEIIE